MQQCVTNGILKLSAANKKRGYIVMQTNDLGFIASILFVLVPALFLVLLYTLTASRESGSKDS